MLAVIGMISRYLLGLAYLVFGLNYFFNFIPTPEFHSPAKEFMGILFTTNFMLTVKIIEISCAVLLLIGLFPRLAAVILMPISVNILLFHTLIEQASPIVGIVLVSVNFLILVGYFEDFKAVFKAN